MTGPARRRRCVSRLSSAAAVAAVALALAPAGAAPAQGNSDAVRRVHSVERRSVTVLRRVESVSGDIRTNETPEQIEVTLAADVLFAFDQAELTPEAASKVDEVVEQLNADGTGAVAVVGHTDSKGEPAYNDDLSKRRAQAVRDALAAKAGGFTYTVDGRGEDEPIAPNETEDGSDDPDGRARNRRVTITFARKN